MSEGRGQYGRVSIIVLNWNGLEDAMKNK